MKYDKKYVLCGHNRSKYISYCDEGTGLPIIIYENAEYPVKILPYLNNEEYDIIFMKSVILLYLYDASAVNTIIECIVRNVPIFVNKLPAVVEYLGNNYPLYYKTIDDVPNMIRQSNLIFKAHKYLKHMNKDFLRMQTFIDGIKFLIS